MNLSLLDQSDALTAAASRTCEAAHSPNLNPTYPVMMTRAEGCRVWDSEGREYLDMVAGYSALNLGHARGELIMALSQQAARLALISRVFPHDRSGRFLQKLSAFSGYQKAVLMNSGAEAVETMIKAARRWGAQHKGTGEQGGELIVFDGNFHGRTITTSSAASTPAYKHGYAPLTPGFRVVPFGDLEATEAAIGPHTVGFLFEAIQGRGGVIIPPEDFLPGLRRLADQHNLLLLADEVQAGLGRTGRRFAFEHSGIRPDGVAIGKSLSGGIYPVSAFLADAPLMDVFTPGSHGSTFGGNPLACAVAEAALDILQGDGLIERAAHFEDYLRPRLRELEGDVVSKTRIQGLWFALVINLEKAQARDLCTRMVAQGILADACPGNVIRFSPPLIVEEHQLDRALEVVRQVIGEMS